MEGRVWVDRDARRAGLNAESAEGEGGLWRSVRGVGVVLAMLVVVGLGLVGCASGVVLSRECDVPELAALLAEREALPARSETVRTVVDGRALAVHVRVVGDSARPRERVIVLVHGMLADHRAFRFVEAGLARGESASAEDDADLLLVDMPGFGSSEVARGQKFDERDCGVEAIAERVVQAVEGVLAREASNAPAARRIALVGHSMGGAVVLRAMCDPLLRSRHAGVLDRVDRMVLIAPVDVAVPTPPRSVVRFLETSEAMFGLGGMTGELRRDIERETALQTGAGCTPLVEEAGTRLEYLDDASRRRVMRSMFLQASPITAERRPDWARVAMLEDQYQRLDDAGPVAVLLVWGRFDEFTPVAGGYKLASQVPGARLHVFDGVKHSPQIERPAEVVGLVRGFLEE